MPTTNNQNQAQALLDEFKAVNEKARRNLDELDKKIAALDLRYAKSLVQHDINMMQAAKSVLLGKKK